jgi:hypothetical protein
MGARRDIRREIEMKNFTWFDAVALLAISLMSILAGVAGPIG